MGRLWQVPVYSQPSINLCWRACGRMMWHWRHRSEPEGQRQVSFEARARTWLAMDRGISEQQMNRFYGSLGMQPIRGATGDALRTTLDSSPVIFVNGDMANGHAMIAVQHMPSHSAYNVINPAGTTEINFMDDTGSATARVTRVAAARVEGRLGHFLWYWR